MNMQEIRAKAKMLGLKTGGRRKTLIIREIQAKEGNTACFQTGVESCVQTDCCWRSDCISQ